MTTAASAWLVLAAACALANWFGVATARRPIIYVSKPLTMVLLMGFATALDARSDLQRWVFVAALVASLVGDVFLMLPTPAFIHGLLAFFVAHLAYIVGLRTGRDDVVPLIVSAFIVLLAIGVVGQRILAAVRERSPALTAPVTAYIAIIAGMGASALASGIPLAATGAVLFMGSDSLIAWNRFVRPLRWAPLAIIVSYHIGQAMLVASLAIS